MVKDQSTFYFMQEMPFGYIMKSPVIRKSRNSSRVTVVCIMLTPSLFLAFELFLSLLLPLVAVLVRSFFLLP